MTDNELADLSIRALKNAYAPYSGFKVGAALLTKSGECFLGCNTENASFPAGICAERAAISAAVTAGFKEFKKIAISGGKNGVITDYWTPCGVCRQVLSEFCGKDFKIITFNGKNIKAYTLGELLPYSFGGDNLCE